MITSHTRIYLLLSALVLTAVLSQGCTSSNEKRPSPLTVDSIDVSGVRIKIHYSSPSVRERKIWGSLVPYNEVWRTGANEATYLELSHEISINSTPIPAGKYALFTIPTDQAWTIILNSEWDQWGAYNYNPEKDVARFNVTPVPSDFNERMTFTLTKSKLKFDWENLSYELQLTL